MFLSSDFKKNLNINKLRMYATYVLRIRIWGYFRQVVDYHSMVFRENEI